MVECAFHMSTVLRHTVTSPFPLFSPPHAQAIRDKQMWERESEIKKQKRKKGRVQIKEKEKMPADPI